MFEERLDGVDPEIPPEYFFADCEVIPESFLFQQ